VDVEVVFLNGILDEIIYMECPDGSVCEADEVVRLNKSIYGLVQVARQFFLKFKSILISVGFTQCKAEPCLFNYMIMMMIHVDDCYMIRKMETINQAVKHIESKGLKLKVEYNKKDYLSREILLIKKNGGVPRATPTIEENQLKL
jgi:Reverse transcriptase (RNA-dependent DNA polymerase)